MADEHWSAVKATSRITFPVMMTLTDHMSFAFDIERPLANSGTWLAFPNTHWDRVWQGIGENPDNYEQHTCVEYPEVFLMKPKPPARRTRRTGAAAATDRSFTADDAAHVAEVIATLAPEPVKPPEKPVPMVYLTDSLEWRNSDVVRRVLTDYSVKWNTRIEASIPHGMAVAPYMRKGRGLQIHFWSTFDFRSSKSRYFDSAFEFTLANGQVDRMEESYWVTGPTETTVIDSQGMFNIYPIRDLRCTQAYLAISQSESWPNATLYILFDLSHSESSRNVNSILVALLEATYAVASGEPAPALINKDPENLMAIASNMVSGSKRYFAAKIDECNAKMSEFESLKKSWQGYLEKYQGLADEAQKVNPTQEFINAELVKLKAIPGVVSVRASANTLSIETVPIEIEVKSYGRIFKLGKYLIQIQPTITGTRSTIKIRNLNGQRHERFDHPHVNDGNPCWGNAEAVYELVDKCEFSSAVGVIMEYLKSYYAEGRYTSIEYWPSVPIPIPSEETKK